MSDPQTGTAERRGARRVRDLRGPRRDRGQAAIEFTGVMPVLLVTVVLLWQAAMIGYTFSLAGNAADEAVRAGTVAPPGSRGAACQEAGEDDLPDAWSATIHCDPDGDLVRARVDLKIPLLFPGSINIPFTHVPGRSAAMRES